MTFYPPARAVDRIFLHCSASDHPDHDNAATMDRWHKERGWSGIGYHYFIRKDGTLEEGRNLEEIPAAQQGHNTGTIAICCHGLEHFTDAQFDTLYRLCSKIDDAYDPRVTFHGHCEVSNKSCPVFDYKAVLKLDHEGYMVRGTETLPVEPTAPDPESVEYRFWRIEQLAQEMQNEGYKDRRLGDIEMHSRIGRNMYLDEKDIPR